MGRSRNFLFFLLGVAVGISLGYNIYHYNRDRYGYSTVYQDHNRDVVWVYSR